MAFLTLPPFFVFVDRALDGVGKAFYIVVGRVTRLFSMVKAEAPGSGPVFDTSEPPTTPPTHGKRKLQQVLPIRLRQIPVRKIIVGHLAGAFQAHPLLVGAVLLFCVSTLAGRAEWGFPVLADATIGGQDVEEVIIDQDASSPVSQEQTYISSAGISTITPVSEEDTVSAAEDEGLVTVPWSPSVVSGSSARNVARYTVREGDTLSSIAQAFHLNPRSIAWSNDLVDPDSIKPGDELRIPPVNGMLHVVKAGETVGTLAKRFSANEAEMLAFNGIAASGALVAGDEIVIPGGAPPAPPPPPKPKFTPRSSAPQFATSQVPLGYFIAPTTGRNYGRIHSHNGVDIANHCGTPIYAAASGTVETEASYSARGAIPWGGGYGVHVLIHHANGTETRYAHLSQIIVGSGHVDQGQLVGLMGTTGRSTGCHLHFEVHGARNPLAR